VTKICYWFSFLLYHYTNHHQIVKVNIVGAEYNRALLFEYLRLTYRATTALALASTPPQVACKV
jgi:hypothetical protein